MPLATSVLTLIKLRKEIAKIRLMVVMRERKKRTCMLLKAISTDFLKGRTTCRATSWCPFFPCMEMDGWFTLYGPFIAKLFSFRHEGTKALKKNNKKSLRVFVPWWKIFLVLS
jgi:hypothetical protein